MRKTLLLLSFLLLSYVVEGQIIRANPNHRAVVSAPADPEMISNGAFADGTDWTAGAQWTISGGVASYDNTGTATLYQVDADMVSSVQINTAYTLELDLVSTGAAAFMVYNSGGAVVYKGYATYTTGHQTITFTTPADVGVAGIAFVPFDDVDFTIDNVSLIAD